MQVKLWKTEDVIPYENNPRINDSAIEPVAASIKEFGFQQPIVLDKDGVIIVGHTRLEAAKSLGLTRVPCVVADELTDEQVKAYRLADNKTNEFADWALDELEVELSYIHDIDMSEFGFEDFGMVEVEDVLEDSYDVDQELLPRTQAGEIYQLGSHRLMCGDATSEQDVQKLMGGELADLVVTDPPYNIAYEGGTSEKLTIKNDDMADTEFLEFLTVAFLRLQESMRQGAGFYIFHADTEGYNFRKALKQADFQLRQTLIWNKNVFTFGRQDYQWKHEPILYGWKDGAAHYFINQRNLTTVLDEQDGKDLNKLTKAELLERLESIYEAVGEQTTVIDEDKPTANREHPTMKPIKLIARLVNNSSKAGQLVLDTFGGSGSTLIACEQMERKCYTMELDPKYCDVIIDRWETFTGEQAIKTGGAT